MLLKVAQLAALPVALVAVSLTVTPRHPRPRAGAPGALAPQEERAFFARGAAPTNPVDLAAPLGPPRDLPPAGSWFQVTVVAELPDDAATARAHDELRALLAASAQHHEDFLHKDARARLHDARSAAPVTPAEAAAFDRAGVESSVGVGWPGASRDAAGAALRLGRLLVVPGLKADFASQQPNPLVALLAARGARVAAEGDPATAAPGLGPALDLTCAAPDEAAAARLADALAHYFAASALEGSVRPPWHPSGVTADQARARATYVAVARALDQALADPSRLRDLDIHVQPGVDSADELQRQYHEVLRRSLLDAVDAVGERDGSDRAVVEEYRRALAAWTPQRPYLPDPAAARRLAERMGSLSLDVAAPGAPGAAPRLEPTAAERALTARGRAQAVGRRVELSGVTFHRVARGLPALLGWLREARCSEARLGLSR